MRKIFIPLCIFVLIASQIFAQVSFRTVQGTKANYSISIPTSYVSKETIGANVDLKFADINGASIITVVRKLPVGVTDEQIIEMSYPSDNAIKNQMESTGLEEVTFIKRGMTIINGIHTYYQYYTSNVDGSTLYYHSLSQFHKGKMVVLTCTCEYSKKFNYMPYINRVVNSLVHKYN